MEADAEKGEGVAMQEGRRGREKPASKCAQYTIGLGQLLFGGEFHGGGVLCVLRLPILTGLIVGERTAHFKEEQVLSAGFGARITATRGRIVLAVGASGFHTGEATQHIEAAGNEGGESKREGAEVRATRRLHSRKEEVLRTGPCRAECAAPRTGTERTSDRWGGRSWQHRSGGSEPGRAQRPLQCDATEAINTRHLSRTAVCKGGREYREWRPQSAGRYSPQA